MKRLLVIATVLLLSASVAQAQWWPWGNEKKEAQQKEQTVKKQELEKQRQKQYERWRTYYKQAEAKARQFTEDKGYTIQSCKNINYGNFTTLSYTFDITTSDLSSSGTLIYIMICVKKQGEDYIVDLFRPVAQ